MTTLEILAVILAVIIIVKNVTLLIKPELSKKMLQAVMKKRKLVFRAYLVLAVLLGYILFQHIGVVEVAAVMLFAGMVIGLILLQYPSAIQAISGDMAQDDRKAIWQKGWLAISLSLILAISVLFKIFVNFPE